MGDCKGLGLYIHVDNNCLDLGILFNIDDLMI